jgi:hypothetical protein
MSRLVLVSLVLTLACTAEAPRSDGRPPKVSSRPVKSAPPPDLEPLPVEPKAPESTPTLEPAPNTSQWWCLCYRRTGADGPEPVTACREQESQCRKLEQRVGKGSDEIIAGSLMQSCRSVIGTHPSDVAGTREQWEPSALPGAWVSNGACLLVNDVPTEPTLHDQADQPDTPEPDEQGDEWALMRSELIGDIAIGQEAAAIRKAHGQPQRTGAIEEFEATGAFEQRWEFGDGLTVLMQSHTRSGPQSVSGVIVVAPSTLTSRRGIAIGSDRAAVERAYGDVRDPDIEATPESFTAGSIYGGLHFSFEDGKVTQMFLGQAAE